MIQDFLFNQIIKSDYVKAFILANARHVATAAGTYLVIHGLANQSIADQLLGLTISIVSFYLANLDVKLVDGKIKVALNTPVPTTPVEVKELPPVEAKK